MDILKLQPCGKDYLWGGTRLRDEYGKKIDLTPLAETWECSVHPDGPSVIANGGFKGQTLTEVLQQHPEYLGTKVKNGELPVLVKFIDAKKTCLCKYIRVTNMPKCMKLTMAKPRCSMSSTQMKGLA